MSPGPITFREIKYIIIFIIRASLLLQPRRPAESSTLSKYRNETVLIRRLGRLFAPPVRELFLSLPPRPRPTGPKNENSILPRTVQRVSNTVDESPVSYRRWGDVAVSTRSTCFVRNGCASSSSSNGGIWRRARHDAAHLGSFLWAAE